MPPKRVTEEADAPVAKKQKTAKQLPSYTLYVRNLNDKLPASKLKQNLYILFSTYADVIAINCLNKGKSRGQAWVVLSSLEESQLALSRFDGELFFGKPLVVEFSKEKSRVIEELES